jgi:hypothetical protein
MQTDGRFIGSQIEKRDPRLRKEMFIQQGPGSSIHLVNKQPQAILT